MHFLLRHLTDGNSTAEKSSNLSSIENKKEIFLRNAVNLHKNEVACNESRQPKSKSMKYNHKITNFADFNFFVF